MEFVGHALHVLHEVVDLAGHTPVEFLYLGAGFEVDDAVAEELEHLVAYLLGIVPALEGAALGQVVPLSGTGAWTVATFPLDELTATTGQYITVVAIDSAGAVVAAGNVTITSKA